LGFCKISEHVEETALSEALPPAKLQGVRPDWRPVNRFSPGIRHSPHYGFHGAIHQIRTLSLIWEASEADQSVKAKTALHILALWQNAGSYSLAARYLDGLADLTDKSKKEKLIQSVQRMEMPLDRVEGKLVIRSFFYPDGSPLERYQGYFDASGKFVRDGTWESWQTDGKRETYGHFENDTHHGLRFEWDREGKLTAIAKYQHNTLSEYEYENLEKHPDYLTAQGLVPKN
jgi:hypothetical protein